MTETALAFDIGLKRTGVAVGQTLTRTTQPAGQLRVTNGRFDWLELKKIIDQWQPNRIILGDPKSDDANLNKVINRFKHHIREHYKLPIEERDEAYTSAAANSELNELRLGKSTRIEMRDQIAACLILQSYFDQIDL